MRAFDVHSQMTGVLLSLLLAVSAGHAEVARVKFDFSGGGGREFYQSFPVTVTNDLECVAFTLKCPFRHRILFRITDATGQVFQRDLVPVTGIWWRYRERLQAPWEFVYGGAGDKTIHQPLRHFDLYVHNPKLKFMHRDEVLVKDIDFESLPEPGQPRMTVNAAYGRSEAESAVKVTVSCPRRAFAGGKVAVRWTDWDGNPIMTKAVDCPPVASGGEWTASLPFVRLPAGKNAMFAKVALNGDGVWLRADGPAWARRPPPVANAGKQNAHSPFGTGIYCQRWGLNSWALEHQLRPLVESARDAGLKWLRDQVIWYQVNRNGRVDFAAYDDIVRLCEECGMSLCMLFGGIDPQLKNTDPDYCERYCAALRQVVRHYRGRVAAWELCNEPNLPWPVDPKWQANYLRLLTMATKVIHEEDPAARSVGGSASGLGLGWLKTLGGEAHDDVSIHPYRRFMDEREFLADMTAAFVAAKDRQIWMTEIGWTGWHRPFGGVAGHPEERPVGFREQAAQLARAYLTAAAAPEVKVVCGYDFVDDGPLACGREAHLGVVHGEYKLGFLPKPAYLALATIGAHFQSGSPTLECRDDGVVVFTMDGNQAYWARTRESVRCRLPKTGTLVNLAGESVEPEVAANGERWANVDCEHFVFVKQGE